MIRRAWASAAVLQAGLRVGILVGILVGTLGACDEDEPAFDPPMIVGPYLGSVPLGPDTRTRLPAPAETIAPDDQPRFYWYHPEAPGQTLTWEVRAETTALAHGSLIHTEDQPVPAGPENAQGMQGFDPTRLSRGGARRNAAGRLEWLPGIYSAKARLGRAEPFATGIFEVR